MSGTAYPELFGALAAPFRADEVRTRQQAGRALVYITARTAMNRLDEVLGPENWWARYAVISDHALVCRLTIQLPDGRRVTKVDAGAKADMADEGDGDKSGFSDALKRAAVLFGVGRYLYGDGVARYSLPPEGVDYGPPPRPDADLDVPLEQPPAPAPATNGYHAPAASTVQKWQGRVQPTEASEHRNGKRPPAKPHPADRVPRTGRELYGWCRDADSLLNDQWKLLGPHGHLTTYCQRNGLPDRLVDYDEELVADLVERFGPMVASHAARPYTAKS